MLLKQKYIRCFTLEKSEALDELGYEFLYEKDGVYYHKNNEELTAKFSADDVLEDVKFSMWIGL